MDEICPASTQFAVHNRITSEKSMIIYPNFDHDGLPAMNDSNFECMVELWQKMEQTGFRAEPARG